MKNKCEECYNEPICKYNALYQNLLNKLEKAMDYKEDENFEVVINCKHFADNVVASVLKDLRTNEVDWETSPVRRYL